MNTAPAKTPTPFMGHEITRVPFVVQTSALIRRQSPEAVSLQALSRKEVEDLADRLHKKLRAGLVAAALILTIASPASASQGFASWYSKESCQREGTSGIWTASRERFDERANTCALNHRHFGGFYRVTNLENGKSVVVRHNDLGPGKKPRRRGVVIDLSKGAFRKIADLKQGRVRVHVEAL